MILINDEQYNPLDLEDISKIIREKFSYDLADKMDELVQEFENELENLKNEINSSDYIFENIINDKDKEIYQLREQVDELIEEIRELESK